ncbi:winged helix-turn-helix domain-containing protein [Kitasatospora acidiphila]|uniref:winged helix-turn-helix domain-containing protein n=1 Tax=Kitasatospora acidiphila TaxID=2567942 RepID=UPI0015F01239|nr:crosslink repair DNA glycosylase YcaQ family protein [Kitasatospora acidiphila]
MAVSQAQARRLAISRQLLSGARPPAGAEGVRAVCRSLRFLQLDPISVVARSHELVLWSRLGAQGVAAFDEVCWRDRWLFEYWAHAAAIVLSEDYPQHRVVMDAYPQRGGEKIDAWIAANDRLRRHVLDHLGEGEPLPTDAFEDCAVVDWPSSGWTNGRNVERMLGFLWRQGKVMIAARAGGRRLWGLPDACLPPDVVREPLAPRAMVTAAVEHSLRARGLARALDVKQYFLPDQYVDLPGVLDELTKQGRIQPVRIEGAPASETWYVHADSLSRLEAIRVGDWEGRTALLSPFDNMINDRRLTGRLWSFDFRNEMYVPKAQRKFGYYVLPVLHGDQLVGRVAPRIDRRRRVLAIEGLWLEPEVKPTAALRRAITAELTDLAAFAGADAVEFGDRDTVPDRWRSTLLG